MLKPGVIAAGVIIAVFAGLRIWRLDVPHEIVFDEVHFARMATGYLTGDPIFDSHPPLGKLLIAIGELVFGDTPLGWRSMPLLAGLAILPAMYWVCRLLFDDRRAGLIATAMLAMDGFFIVYSRTSLLDGFMLLFGLAATGFCLRFVRARYAGERAWLSLVLTGAFVGLTAAVKWIGAGFLPLLGATAMLGLVRRTPRASLATDAGVWLASFTVLPAGVYLLPFLANWRENFFQEVLRWHQQAWSFNVSLAETHPYASPWWSWPLLMRPIWFYFQVPDGQVVGIDGIGHPLIWWGTAVAVIVTIGTLCARLFSRLTTGDDPDWRRTGALIFAVAGWAVFFLPWMGIGRVVFIYHYLLSYLFALLLAAFWLSRLAERRHGRLALSGLFVAAVGIALGFAPIWIAYPIPQAWFDRLIWFRSWI